MSYKMPIIHIDNDICLGCGECEADCPEGAIYENEYMDFVWDFGQCVGCGICADSCEVGALTIEY